ncbi:MAG: hypothetical protein HKN25_13555 [Pyrinomonadaceae bacterium]|nr:hypothetical protein [Pyrinomonadaceae bacterium]
MTMVSENSEQKEEIAELPTSTWRKIYALVVVFTLTVILALAAFSNYFAK